MEKVERRFPDWFGDDTALTSKGQVGRIIMVLGYFVFGVLVAIVIFRQIQSLETFYATGGLGVVTLAWTIKNYKRIWELVLGLWRHIRKNAFFDFTREIPSLVVPILVVLFTLVVANREDTQQDTGFFGGIAGQFDRIENFLNGRSKTLSREDIQAAIRPVIQAELANLPRLRGDDRQAAEPERLIVFRDPGSDQLRQYFGNAIFPLRFVNAKIESPLPKADDFDIERVKWMPGPEGGTELTDEQIEELRQLLQILAPCTLEPVKLEISGFASSLQFSEYDEHWISNELNLAAANRRAERVRTRLEKLRGDFEKADTENLFTPVNFKIGIHIHSSFTEMLSHRPFNDRPGGLGENESEALNRSVLIQIGAIGACEARG